MDELQWLGENNPEQMLAHLFGEHRIDQAVDYLAGVAGETIRRVGPSPNERKHRLLACAIVRSLWSHLPDECSRVAVKTAERLLDGEATLDEYDLAWRLSWGARKTNFAPSAPALVTMLWWNFDRDGSVVVNIHSYDMLAEMIGHYRSICGGLNRDLVDRTLADLIRHVIGNPFASRDVPKVSSSARQLADAIVAGEDCDFALHDALLESGLAPDHWLVKHFLGRRPCDMCRGMGMIERVTPPDLMTVLRQVSASEPPTVVGFKKESVGCPGCAGAGMAGWKTHPRGCWALDIMRGKS